MPKHFTLLANLLLSLPLAAQTALYAPFLIPADLTRDANTVLRSSETVFHVENASDATVERSWAVTILNEKGEEAATLYCAEGAFSKVKLMEGRLYDATGQLVRESTKKDIREYGGSAEYEYQDYRIKYLSMTMPTYPYTVAFRTKEQVRGFFQIPEFGVQELGQAVQEASYKLVAPNTYRFKWKGVNTDAQPQMTTEGNETAYTWTVKNLSARPLEPHAPYFGGQCAEIIFAPEKVEIDGYSGNFGTWEQVGRFFYSLNRDRDELPAEMLPVVKNLTATAKTNREKIDALYRYLQANHRYVSIQLGIGGWQTFDAQFVTKNRYGDCKALSNYMKALLKAVGIPAMQALIYAGESGAPPLHPDLAVPRFNHAILYVPGENLWLECTSNSAPTGYLGDFTAGRQALLLSPEGGKLVSTPALTHTANLRSSQTDIALDENGHAEVQNHVATTGNRHDYYRTLSKEKNATERDKAFAENLPVGIAQLRNFVCEASEQSPSASLRYQMLTNGYAARSGKRMFVPLLKISPLRRSLPADDSRSLDLRITEGYTLRDTVTLRFPVGYEAENVPTGKKIESEFGTYELAVERAADRLRVVRAVELQPVAVPAARYGEVRQFYLDMAKLDGAQAVLVKK